LSRAGLRDVNVGNDGREKPEIPEMMHLFGSTVFGRNVN